MLHSRSQEIVFVLTMLWLSLGMVYVVATVRLIADFLFKEEDRDEQGAKD